MTVFGVDSEVGRLRAVILHRPGAELQRLTPRNNDALLFDGLPWVARAQQEHDAFAALLRSRDIEVLLLAELLAEALASGAARMQGIAAAVDLERLGRPLAQELSAYLRTLQPVELARILVAGATFTELPLGARVETSLVRRMQHSDDFVIEPLPNLMFTRDSSFWIGSRVAITSLALPARMRETSLTDLVYAHHPRFRGVRRAYESHTAPVEGGDVLLMGPGVVAVGVGERTTPAGAEALARSLFDDDLAHTVLAVPIAQQRPTMHLDTVCTMVDVDVAVMYLGQVMEIGPAEDIYAPPYHPYSEALLSAVPIPDPTVKQKYIRLEGSVPSAINPPDGCRFHTRCPRRNLLPDGGKICETEIPPWREISAEHRIFCHLPIEILRDFAPVVTQSTEEI